jgi:hypothetical protein
LTALGIANAEARMTKENYSLRWGSARVSDFVIVSKFDIRPSSFRLRSEGGHIPTGCRATYPPVSRP